MTTTRECPQCGAEMAETVEGLCPACLLKRGLATKTGADGSSGNVPVVEEIAKRFPQLEILELLGAGGMGVVYKARQPQLDRFVALKVLPAEAGRDPAFAERFTREARALAKLSHPNIVGVYDFGQAEGLYYFIMEFVDGANLRQMERAGKLTAAQALAIVPKICDALQYAHDEGVVHRDIKPENILVDKKGRVKIADFGLAKLLGKAATDFTLTGAQQAMGTPHYMAPEQMEKPLSVDHRVDIYSLGVVFYEMLTGELPLGRFQPPSAKVHVDVRLDEVVLRSMERDVERRYQHVSEVKTDVETITKSGTGFLPVSPKTLGHEAQATPKPGTSPLKIVLIVVGCLVAMPVVIVLITSPLWFRAMETARSRLAQRMTVTTLKSFTATDPTISKDLVLENGAWLANCTEPRTIQLFEVPNPGVDDCTVTYRAQLKTENLKGRAYLEMWCRLPGSGEFFSKGLNQTVSGSKDWASYEIPFFLKKGEKPDLLRLNLVVEGIGRVGIRNVEMQKTTKR